MFVVQLLKINQSMHCRMMKTKTHILGSNVEPSKLNHATPEPNIKKAFLTYTD